MIEVTMRAVFNSLRTDGSPRNRGFVAVAAAAVVTAFAVGACGGSSTLSHAQLVSRASSDCRRANQAAAHLAAPSSSYSSLNQYARGLSPIVTGLIGNLNSLKPASADRTNLRSYVGALRSGDQGLQLLVSANSPAQVTQARTILASQPLTTRASALGAAACGEAP
jgi:hypothetical protein